MTDSAAKDWVNALEDVAAGVPEKEKRKYRLLIRMGMKGQAELEICKSPHCRRTRSSDSGHDVLGIDVLNFLSGTPDGWMIGQYEKAGRIPPWEKT